jgi:hypothetical protein
MQTNTSELIKEWVIPESIEWFVEDQPFSRSFGSCPTPSPPLLPVSSTGNGRGRETEGWGEVGGGGAKSYDRKKAWSSTNNFILFGRR